MIVAFRKSNKYFRWRFAISGEIKCYKPSDKFVSNLRNHVTEPYAGILFVGDADVDVQTAKKLGAKAVLIDRKQRKSVNNYDYYITSLLELKEIVSKNTREGEGEKCLRRF
jgi:phosphoglycolate phosphatase-like HAD superfamily hydrolase